MDNITIKSLSIIQRTLHQNLQISTSEILIKHQRTSTNNPIQTVTESEKIETYHLGFAKSLFQYYYTHLRLTNNNFTFNNFFSELLQSTILSQNYLFAPLITEINREIEKYTKQRFSITFANKRKERLQTLVGTPKQIQLPIWKKQRFDLPANPLYHHTPGNTINIISTTTVSMTTPLNRVPFQNFGAVNSWEITDSKEEESSDQETSKQNLILENPEIKTPINSPPIPPIAEQQQQPQLLPQQQIQQQPPQQSMAYTLIAKIKKFISEEDDTQNYLSLLVTPEDAQTNNLKTNQQSTLTNNIPPAIITKNKSLDAIFLFELKELSITPLFSRAALEKKFITAMYTNVKVDGHLIKLILDSKSAGSIITRQLMNQLGYQYQALISNNWLSKTNTTLDWTMQELQLSQDGQHTYVPAICSHFKNTTLPAPLIDFKEEEKKPIWEVYQVL
ncbi:hypothetical protein G9A89_014034 [Geosiphon pyriformis]|nr:hypothetical protein G9A89_014034 [Geosiphon pyriformis]